MKHIILASALLMAMTSLNAQPATQEDRDAKRAEIEKQKVAYISTQLDLTIEESQQFWPIYNAYNAELADARTEMRGEKRAMGKGAEEMTDAEVEALIRNKFAAERRKVEIDEKYFEKFKTVIPIQKVAAYYRAEADFKRELLDQMRARSSRGGRPSQAR